MTKSEQMTVAAIELAEQRDPSKLGLISDHAAQTLIAMSDRDLGWSLDSPMPEHLRVYIVSSHLMLGLSGGADHFVYLEKKSQFYIKGSALRYLASRDPDWHTLKSRYQPLTAQEKVDYGLDHTDIAVVRYDTIKRPYGTEKITGLGVIDAKELASSNEWAKTRKNQIKTAKTRADRDLYATYYPIDMPVLDNEHELTPKEQPKPAQIAKSVIEKAPDEKNTPEAVTKEIQSDLDNGLSADSIIKKLLDRAEKEKIDKTKVLEALGASSEADLDQGSESLYVLAIVEQLTKMGHDGSKLLNEVSSE